MNHGLFRRQQPTNDELVAEFQDRLGVVMEHVMKLEEHVDEAIAEMKKSAPSEEVERLKRALSASLGMAFGTVILTPCGIALTSRCIVVGWHSTGVSPTNAVVSQRHGRSP